MKYYDLNTKGFYEEASENRIELTEQKWQELIDKQSQGGLITAVNGQAFCKMPYEKIQEGKLVDISDTEEYKAELLSCEKERVMADLKSQMAELDIKRIRAIAEPQLKDSEGGQTWLEYYTSQIVSLREQILSLM